MNREDIPFIWCTKQVKEDTEIKHGRTRRWVMQIGLFEPKYNPPQHWDPHSNFTSGIASPATNSQTQLWLGIFHAWSWLLSCPASPSEGPSCSHPYRLPRVVHRTFLLHRAHSNRPFTSCQQCLLSSQHSSALLFFLNYLLPGFRFIPVTHCCSDLLGVPLPKVPAQQITVWLHQEVLPNQCSLSIRVTS